MKLHSYIITHDTGFSPNPFWGFCTLADCKPVIRRTANIRDWVVGLSPKANGNKIIYAMEVNEILSFTEYFNDNRFRNKKPDFSKNSTKNESGDNIYKPLRNGEFKQIQSRHSHGTNENPDTKKRDLSGKNVLISKNFHYFGSKPLDLPNELNELIVGRAHKNKFTDIITSYFIDFISPQKMGVIASPTNWPKDDTSWSKVK